MGLALIDWLVVGAYVGFALLVGIRFARRAGQDVEEFFLSGRTLPWWIAGTSMVATSFAADTPLVITGWVRDHGIWKNWLWWCFAANGMLTVFLFARYWRRGGVMTKAEFAELRYGGRGAGTLRGFLGFYHAGVTNTITLCWVLLAAAKIMDVVFEVDKVVGLVLACEIALTYSLLAGFWGVVLTDLLQFVMAMTGAAALAFITWNAAGGLDGLMEVEALGGLRPDTLAFLPSAVDGVFWTTPVATVALFLGAYWWTVESVDGSGTAVQRIAASRDERQGVLATLWFNVAHYALRPWPWIAVALASLVILPHQEILAPVSGTVTSVGAEEMILQPDDGSAPLAFDLGQAPASPDWRPVAILKEGEAIEAGKVLARTDSESAYVVMMMRFLPAGLLGLVVASLLAAFMSTIDTHLNLASSFFVNDVYRRFMKSDAEPRHYVLVARITSLVVMVMAGLFAWRANSISDLFQFFLSFLAGVGPVYLLRWFWWRVRPSTEISAMVASSIAAVALHMGGVEVDLGPFTDPDGAMTNEGKHVLVVLVSIGAAMLSMLFTRPPDPQQLVPFYRRIRPVGFWGPVRALAPDVRPATGEAVIALSGSAAGLAMVYGFMLGTGFLLLGRDQDARLAGVVGVLGAVGVAFALRALYPRSASSPGDGPEPE